LDVDDVEEDVVAVTAIRRIGSNVYELAAGFAEVRDEYTSCNALLLIFVRVLCAELQQTFIYQT
jgi:hypothetical protein